MNAPDGDQPIARVSYSAAWYDELGRTTATADYGTADGVPPARPATVPERSDTVLVSETRYNDRGEAFATIDPARSRLAYLRRTVSRYRDTGRVPSREEQFALLAASEHTASDAESTLIAWLAQHANHTGSLI